MAPKKTAPAAKSAAAAKPAEKQASKPAPAKEAPKPAAKAPASAQQGMLHFRILISNYLFILKMCLK
jgi:hypothetical protein